RDAARGSSDDQGRRVRARAGERRSGAGGSRCGRAPAPAVVAASAKLGQAVAMGDGLTVIEKELEGERASSLGEAGKRLENALLALGESADDELLYEA